MSKSGKARNRAKATSVPVPIEIPTAAKTGMNTGAIVILIVAIAFAAAYAFNTLSSTRKAATGVVGTVDGQDIKYSDLASGTETKTAENTAAEDVLNYARQVTFEKYLDEKGVKAATDADIKKTLESVAGTLTVKAAAKEFGTTEAALREDLAFESRMNAYKETYTGLDPDTAPKAPAGSGETSASAMEYQSDMEAFTQKQTAADLKWQKLIESVFRKADVRVFTLTMSQQQ